MKWVKSSVQATTSLGVAGKATGGKKKKCKAEARMATAKFQRWVATQIWGRDKQGARHAGQGRGERDLGQARRGRDVQLVSRPGLEGVGVATFFLVLRPGRDWTEQFEVAT